MSPRGVVPREFGYTEVETCSSLDYRFMYRGKEYMILRIDLRLRHYEQAVVLSGVAANNGGAGVGARAVSPNYLSIKRVIEID
jgi:hypothetical protein